MDNEQKGPLIPAGTEPTVFGTTAFPREESKGQPQTSPELSKLQTASDKGTAQPMQMESPQGITFQELAVKKGFVSPDDLAKAYEHLESRATKAEMSLSDLARSRQEAQTSFEEEPGESQTVASQEDAIKIVERIVRKATRPLEDRIQLQELFLNNPDAIQYGAEMATIIKNEPGTSWNTAYRAAKFASLEKQSKEKGRQEAYQAIKEKEQMVAGSGQPLQQVPALNPDLIRDKSIPFVEIQRIMREKFAQ